MTKANSHTNILLPHFAMVAFDEVTGKMMEMRDLVVRHPDPEIYQWQEQAV